LQEKSKKKKIFILSLFTLPTAFIIAKILSSLYYSPRPFVVNHFTPLIDHAANNGFPSDHALLSFTLASIVFVFNRKWGVALFLMGLAISASRMYAGIHSPVDIIGSLLIGTIVSFIYYLSLKRFSK